MFGQNGGGSGSNGGGGGLNVMQRAPVTLRPTSSNDTCLPWDSCGAPNSAAVPGATAPMMRFRSASTTSTTQPQRTTKVQAKKEPPPRPVMSAEQMHAFIRQQRGGRENTTSRLPPEFRNNTVEIGDRSGRRAAIPADVAKFAREFKPNGGQAARKAKQAPVMAPPTMAPPTLASSMKSTFGGGGNGGGAADFGVAAPSWASSGKRSTQNNAETVNSILRQYGRPMEPKKPAAAAVVDDEGRAAAVAAQRAQVAAAKVTAAAARQRKVPQANSDAVKPATTTTVASDEFIRQMQRQQRKQQKVQRPKPPPSTTADSKPEAGAEQEAPTAISLPNGTAGDETDAQDNADNATTDTSVDNVAEDRWSALQQAHGNAEEEVDAPFFAEEARSAIETAAHKPTVQQESGDEQFTTFSVRGERRA